MSDVITPVDPELRALAEQCNAWPFEEARKIVARLARHPKDEVIFETGYGLSFWLNGASSGGCCVFVGGPFVESRYFGEGIGVGVKRGNDTLRLAINWALFRIWETGRFTDLWLRYFPISPF